MEGIEFEKESYGKPITLNTQNKSWIVTFLMKIGGKYIKDEKQANFIMVIISIIFFVISIYNFFY